MKTTTWTREKLFTLAIGAAIVISLSVAIHAQLRHSSTKGSGKEIKAADYEISGPYSHKNLTVFLIHGPDKLTGKNFLTLQEGLDRKKVIVYETKEVNELAIDEAMREIASARDPEHFPVNPAKHCRMCNFLELCYAGREWLRSSS